jgi:hypothetical protein
VTVLGEVKIVGLLVLSAAILPGESSQFTARMTVGCVLAMLGFCLYSNARLVASRKTSAAAAAGSRKVTQEDALETAEEGQSLLKVLLVHVLEAFQHHVLAPGAPVEETTMCSGWAAHYFVRLSYCFWGWNFGQ